LYLYFYVGGDSGRPIFPSAFGFGSGSCSQPPLYTNDSVGETKYDPYYKDLFSKVVRREIFDGTTPLADTLQDAPPQVLLWPEGSGSDSNRRDGEGENRSSYSQAQSRRLKEEGSGSTILFATVTNSYDGIVCMDIGPSAASIACGFSDSTIRLWTAAVKSLDEPITGLNQDRSLDLTTVLPQQRDVVIDASGSRIRDTSSSSSNQLSADNVSSFNCSQLCGHSKPVYSLSFEPTGRMLLSTSADETVRLWDTSGAQCVAHFDTVGPCWDVEFSPFGFYFALAHQNRTASLYSIDHSTPLRIFCGHSSDVTKCTWHPNAAYLVTGSDDRSVRMWDVRAGPCARELLDCISPITSLAVAAGGHYIAAGCENGVVIVWDVLSGRRIAVLEGHRKDVHALSFSPDDRLLCSGGLDCSVRIWDTSFTGKRHCEMISQPKKTFYTKYSNIYSLKFDSKLPDLIYAGGPFSLNSDRSKFFFGHFHD
jgi:transcription initiation factor TFIID subunit 5